MPEYFSVIKVLKIKSLILEYDTGFAYSLQVDKGLCRATGIPLPCQFLVDLELPSKANMNLHLCWLRVLFQEGKKKRPLFNEDASISTWYCSRNWGSSFPRLFWGLVMTKDLLPLILVRLFTCILSDKCYRTSSKCFLEDLYGSPILLFGVLFTLWLL